MNCTSGCKTRDHESYAECLRAKGTLIAYCNSANGSDYSGQKAFDKENALFRSAIAQGIEPDTTRRKDVERAIRISNETGRPYGVKETNV